MALFFELSEQDVEAVRKALVSAIVFSKGEAEAQYLDLLDRVEHLTPTPGARE